MSEYRVTWPCCGDTTTTDSWEPTECPFCKVRELEAALAKREAVAVPDGYVMVEIGYLPDRCIAAARRDAAIVAKVAPNDDCAILSAAISAYLLAASQQAAKEEGR